MILASIYIAIFLCVLIIGEAVIRYVVDLREKKSYANYRMRLLAKGQDSKEVYRSIIKARGINTNTFGVFSGKFSDVLKQSGLSLGSGRFLLNIVALFIFCIVGCVFLGLSFLISFLISCLTTPLVLLLVILWIRRRRMKLFFEQLPEALDVMIRSISAGHPIHTSVSLVAREMPDPIGTEFGILNDEMTYGLNIEEGTKNMVDRVGVEDLNFLSITLSVQKSSGGNLTEILSNLSDMIRRRSLLTHKVKAISAEGRMTSWFMLAYPFMLYALIFALAPNYFDPVWESGYGNIILTAGFIMMIIGMLILRKIVNFDY